MASHLRRYTHWLPLAAFQKKRAFKEKVESARVQVFLLDDQGKVVGQAVQWVIGGTKSRPPLEPGKTATFNFVLSNEKPFSQSNITVTRIILDGGRSVDPKGNFVVEAGGG